MNPNPRALERETIKRLERERLARERAVAEPVVVEIAGERATVTGAARTVIGWIVRNQHAVNAISFGEFVFEIGGQRVRPRIRMDHERMEIATS